MCPWWFFTPYSALSSQPIVIRQRPLLKALALSTISFLTYILSMVGSYQHSNVSLTIVSSFQVKFDDLQLLECRIVPPPASTARTFVFQRAWKAGLLRINHWNKLRVTREWTKIPSQNYSNHSSFEGFNRRLWVEEDRKAAAYAHRVRILSFQCFLLRQSLGKITKLDGQQPTHTCRDVDGSTIHVWWYRHAQYPRIGREAVRAEYWRYIVIRTSCPPDRKSVV